MPWKLFVLASHQMIPRRKTSPSGVGRCSSSRNVNPPGPARHISSPVPSAPFGIAEFGSNLTLTDHFPESTLIKLCISGEDRFASLFEPWPAADKSSKCCGTAAAGLFDCCATVVLQPKNKAEDKSKLRTVDLMSWLLGVCDSAPRFRLPKFSISGS